jgi:phosphatidylcholine synthase
MTIDVFQWHFQAQAISSSGHSKPAHRLARPKAATADVQIAPIPVSTAPPMEPADHTEIPPAAPMRRAAAFSVHVFTALGAGVALISLLEAVREHWAAMFAWLGLALIIDGADGPMARRLDVVRLQPDWSGEVLDLVVDFVTYVFVPAYAITASGMMLPIAAPLLGIGVAVSGALYFADRRMKSEDNHFRGFPGLWNVAAFYLFLLRWPPALSSLVVAILIVATFLPFHVLHPVRVVRLRWLTLSLMGLWGVLAIYILVKDFQVGLPVTIVMCLIAVYVVASDAAFRLLRSLHA